MEASFVQHGNQLNCQGSGLVGGLDRFEKVVDIEIMADGFCNFSAILVLMIISSLSQDFIGAARGGRSAKYVHLHLVLLRFLIEVPTPP